MSNDEAEAVGAARRSRLSMRMNSRPSGSRRMTPQQAAVGIDDGDDPHAVRPNDDGLHIIAATFHMDVARAKPEAIGIIVPNNTYGRSRG